MVPPHCPNTLAQFSSVGGLGGGLAGGGDGGEGVGGVGVPVGGGVGGGGVGVGGGVVGGVAGGVGGGVPRGAGLHIRGFLMGFIYACPSCIMVYTGCSYRLRSAEKSGDIQRQSFILPWQGIHAMHCCGEGAYRH